MRCSVLLLAAIYAMPAGAQPTTVDRLTAHPAVVVQKSAAEQLRYGETFVRAAALSRPGTQEHVDAVASAVASFRLVAERWPKEKTSASRAALATMQLYDNERAWRNSLEAAASLETAVAGTANEPLFLDYKARAQSATGDSAGADKTYDAAVGAASFAHADPYSHAVVWQHAGDLRERTGQHARAAEAYRKAGAAEQRAISKAVLFDLAVESDAAAADTVNARRDLQQLDRALDEASREPQLGAAASTITAMRNASRKHHARAGG